MKHTCPETVAMYKALHDFTELQKLKVAADTDELKKLQASSKQKFESLLRAKEKERHPPRGASEMVFDRSSRASRLGFSESRPERAKETSKSFQLQGSQPCPLGPGRTLNHIRGRRKFNPRICRHIQKVSSQYHVVCPNPAKVMAEEGLLNKYSVDREVYLVPLKEESLLSQVVKSQDQLETDVVETPLESDHGSESISDQELVKAR